jgi:hypothetical protein
MRSRRGHGAGHRDGATPEKTTAPDNGWTMEPTMVAAKIAKSRHETGRCLRSAEGGMMPRHRAAKHRQITPGGKRAALTGPAYQTGWHREAADGNGGGKANRSWRRLLLGRCWGCPARATCPQPVPVYPFTRFHETLERYLSKAPKQGQKQTIRCRDRSSRAIERSGRQQPSTCRPGAPPRVSRGGIFQRRTTRRRLSARSIYRPSAGVIVRRGCTQMSVALKDCSIAVRPASFRRRGIVR